MKVLRWLTLPRLIAILTSLGVFAMAYRAPLDTDTYWHLRAGQWQIEHRALLATDLFSFTQAGQPWLNVHWLSQILLYGFFLAFGEAGLSLFTALLAAGGMSLIYFACDGDPLIRAFCVLLGAAAAAVFWSARSQMLSFLFSAIVVYLLRQYYNRQADRLWLIPLVMIPWANSHGGFAIGLILLVLAFIGEIADWAFRGLRQRTDEQLDERPSLRSAGRILVVTLVSALAVLVNPFGLSTLLLPMRTVGIGVLRDFIQEWAAPNFHLSQMWPFGVMLIGTFFTVGLSSRRLDIRDGVMLAGTATGALLAGRNIPTFALVAAPVLSSHLDVLVADVHVRLNSHRIPAAWTFVAINWLLLLVVLSGTAARMIYELSPARLEKAQRDVFPVDALGFLALNHPPQQMFNSYNWGGYLIWNARDYPVYVDGRTDLYDDQFIRDYLKIYYAQPGWETKLDAAKVNTVLIETSSPLAQVLTLSPGWTKVYTDSLATIFVRAGSAGR